MSQDVKIMPDKYGIFDLEIENGDFSSVIGLETTIATDLFSDRRADESLVPSPIFRRGFLGDIFRASIGRKLGSQLWTLDQGRLTDATLNRAELYAIEALQYLIEDEIAQSIDVQLSRSARGVTIAVTITNFAGNSVQYDFLWRNTDVANISNR